MFGATHQLAAAVADGLGERTACELAHASAVTEQQLAAADLVVVGGPTMGHTLSTPQSREVAVSQAEHPKHPKPGHPGLQLDDLANAPGLREFFDRIGRYPEKPAAAFDTRVNMNELVTGHASHGIARRLKKHKFAMAANPRSFLVDRDYSLIEGQVAEARTWGTELGAKIAPTH